MDPCLETFMYVYESRSFSLAARELFITQPAVSLKIKQLEQKLGIRLFIRTKHRTIIPTDAGNFLYKQSLSLKELWNGTKDKLNNISSPERRLLRIGFSQTTSQVFGPDFIENFQIDFPLIDCKITIGNTDYIANQLFRKGLDIGIVEKPISINPATIKRKKVGFDQLVRVGKKTGIWFQRETGSGIEHYTTQFFQEYAIVPKKIIQINKNELIMELVNKGIGETIMSNRIISKGSPCSLLNSHFKRTFFSLTSKTLDNELASAVNSSLIAISQN